LNAKYYLPELQREMAEGGKLQLKSGNLVPESKKCSDNNGDMSKRHRANLKRLLVAKYRTV
jgi:hypothetical protein